MIQELIGGVGEERKLSIPYGGLLSDATSAFLSSPSTTNITPSSSSSSPLQPSPASSSPTPGSEPPQQNLRCPRCDSPNTKFCYYNNYNLTQPRHFCKTCRRYWTKGGALRNIPIGGGCRKAKPVTNVSSHSAGKPGGGSKPSKPNPSLDAIARLGLGLDPELLHPSPILWAAAPQQHTSHLLALLRSGGSAVQNNHNPLSSFNPIRFKEEAAHAESDAGGGPGLPGLSLDPLSQFSTTAAMDSLWRNEGQIPYLQQQNNAAPFCDTAVGIQELYRRLRSPVAAAFCNDQLSMSSNGWPSLACSSFPTTDAMATSIGDGGGEDSAAALEPAMGGEFGYWNPALSWSDMSTTN